MGWDGYAKLNGARPLPPEVLGDFAKAAEAARQRAGCVDGCLENGVLDCSACAEALGEMTGLSWWDDHGPVEVQRAWEDAQRYPTPEGEDAWAYESAKAFLEVSARHGLSFYASY